MPASTCRRAQFTLPGAALVIVLAGLPDLGGEEASSAGTLKAANLVALAKRFARYSDDLPSTAQLGMERIVAYEENPYFVYIRGRGQFGDRRVVFCKPATFVFYDIPSGDSPWRLICTTMPEVTGQRLSATEGGAVVTGQVLLPGSHFTVARTNGGHAVEAVWKDPTAIRRFICVFTIGATGAAAPSATLSEKDGVAKVTVTAGSRLFTLGLTAEAVQAGTIALAEGNEDVLPGRLLPAGIMPHGAEGVRVLNRWDSAYRRRWTPGWDTGRAAPELKKAVESGVVPLGRALVLGCGGGMNAVYLAGKGFEVTGVDLAPSALMLAEERARTAQVRVRWLVADVLAMPEIGPFDFIFDRGCYHHVRRYGAARFVSMVTALSHDTTQVLVLAGNANEPRRSGPPRVKQTDIVNDFSAAWDVVWLKEIRFNEARNGAWAWSALLRRTARKE